MKVIGVAGRIALSDCSIGMVKLQSCNFACMCSLSCATIMHGNESLCLSMDL